MTEPVVSPVASSGVVSSLGYPDSLKPFAATKDWSEWIFTSPILLVVFILVLVRRKQWLDFAVRRKWFSRFILFVPMIVLAYLFNAVDNWALWNIPVQITLETPSPTAIAIKIGLYRLFIGQEETRLLAGKDTLLKCIDAVVVTEFEGIKKRCGDDLVCLDKVPPVSRDAIIAQIKESRAKDIAGASAACKDVDVSKL